MSELTALQREAQGTLHVLGHELAPSQVERAQVEATVLVAAVTSFQKPLASEFQVWRAAWQPILPHQPSVVAGTTGPFLTRSLIYIKSLRKIFLNSCQVKQIEQRRYTGTLIQEAAYYKLITIIICTYTLHYMVPLVVQKDE